jgi:hypothetical protein
VWYPRGVSCAVGIHTHRTGASKVDESAVAFARRTDLITAALLVTCSEPGYCACSFELGSFGASVLYSSRIAGLGAVGRGDQIAIPYQR